jgi:hypothetical protein
MVNMMDCCSTKNPMPGPKEQESKGHVTKVLAAAFLLLVLLGGLLFFFM